MRSPRPDLIISHEADQKAINLFKLKFACCDGTAALHCLTEKKARKRTQNLHVRHDKGKQTR